MSTLISDWATIIISGANGFISQGWQHAAALRGAYYAGTQMTSDDTATLHAWCPEKKGYVTQKVALIDGKWKLA